MPKRRNEDENMETASKLLKVEILPEEKKELVKIEISKPEEQIQGNIESPSTSFMNEDKYFFNFWGDSETKCHTEDVKEITKIGNLDSEKIENKSLIVRVTFKSELKDTKFGKVLSCLVIDDTGEIAVVSFGKCALELHKNWEHNHVYCIENFKIQKENENYPSGSNNALQLRTNQNFQYKKMEESDCPPFSFSFKLIEEIKCLKRNTRVDLLGILLKDFGLESNTNNVSMRDISITDKKKGMIIATLWGTAAEKFKSIKNSVIVIRKGVVGEYQEKLKINCTMGTLVWLNPTISEASPLLKWFNDNAKRN